MGKELSQAEIDVLINGGSLESGFSLTDEEKDILGEVGNISMGASATVLSKILQKKVTITTPKVSVVKSSELAEDFNIPYVAIEITYTEGLKGRNILNLKNDDVKMITDLMMGGKGAIAEGPLNEMNLSAVGELMNQMMGASSTALSEMMKTRIDISPPKPLEINYSKDDIRAVVDNDEDLVITIFDLNVEDTLSSEIMQILPASFSKEIVEFMKNMFYSKQKVAVEKVEEIKKVEMVEKVPEKEVATSQMDDENKAKIQKVALTTFGNEKKVKSFEGNRYDILMDVQLEVSVEIGRVNKQISEILQFSSGTIIELDKLVGEDVNIVINSKTIGKGEVVVIDECYGVRISEILENKNV